MRSTGRAVRALRGLVRLERLGGVDVTERGDSRARAAARPATPKRFARVEPSAITFMSPKPGKRADAPLEVGAVGGVRPHACAASPSYSEAIVAHSSCTRLAMLPGEAMHGRSLAESRVERSRIHGRDARSVEVAEPLLAA